MTHPMQIQLIPQNIMNAMHNEIGMGERGSGVFDDDDEREDGLRMSKAHVVCGSYT